MEDKFKVGDKVVTVKGARPHVVSKGKPTIGVVTQGFEDYCGNGVRGCRVKFKLPKNHQFYDLELLYFGWEIEDPDHPDPVEARVKERVHG